MAKHSRKPKTVSQQTLDLIVRSAALPTMPQVVTRFIEISADPEYKVNDLVDVLATDPGISGELLRLTNSALFGVTRQVGSLKQAFTLLGLARVRTLVLGRYITEQISRDSSDTGDFSFSYFWRRSLNTAVLAARFAEHLAPRCREEAFIAGLLADIGVVVMLKGLPDRYKRIAREYAPLRGDNIVDRERGEFGLTHADVSALLLERWMLPPAVVEVVRQHHTDGPSDSSADGSQPVAQIVNGAQLIAKLLCEDPRKNAVLDACATAMDQVGLEVAALPGILGEVEAAIRELADLLRIYLIRSDVYTRICKLIAKQLAEPAATA